jgi:hypothetical protein
MVEVKSIPEIIQSVSPYYKKKGGPESEHTLVYDSSTETLEPIYFFLLDLMNDFGLNPEKLLDNFSSSPGSGHFGEMGQRASVMQQNGTKILADINTVLRSIMNIIYDLREFKSRLSVYDDLRNPEKNEAAILSLKQIWMDKVDIQKGNSSIKAMALGQAGFATLIDAFLVSKDIKSAEKLDLNDKVRRIIIPRIQEFNSWILQSEGELRKRYEIEKTYLRSQVNSLKLYARWAKPYLKAASELEMKDSSRDPALVKAFNTILLEMSLLGKNELRVKETALEGNFPKEFTNEKFLKKFNRKYYGCILVEFKFRGIPQRVQQQSHFAFGGKTEITFRSYALNEEELGMLRQELETSDINAAFSLVKGATDDSLANLKEDLDYFLEEPDQSVEEVPKDQSNPFKALFGGYNKKKPAPKIKEFLEEPKIEYIEPDNWYEKTFFRTKVAENAKETLFSIFDIYKKAHGMASYT